jgi:cobalt-zinc-cadmium efflux system protein
MSRACFVDHHPSPTDHSTGGYSRVKIALFLALGLAAIQGLGSYLSGSLALLADTVHVIADSSSLLFTLVAGWLARRPGSSRRSYGYYRIEVLSAFLSGLVLAGISLAIFYRAFFRLIEPQVVVVDVMLGIALLGFVVNLVMLKIMHPARSESMNIKGAYLHILGDSLSSAAVVLSAVVMLLTQWFWFDAVASMIVGAMIMWMSIRLVRDAAHVLLEGTPRHLDADKIAAQMKQEFPQVKDLHDFHIWEITAHWHSLTAHIEANVNTLEESQALSERLSQWVKDKYNVSHSTWQVERSHTL